MSQFDGADPHPIAPALIGIIEIRMKSLAGDRFRKSAGGKCSRQGKRTVVHAGVRSRAKKIRADFDGRCRLKSKPAGPGGVAVLVVAIDAISHVEPRETKAKARALAQATRTLDPFLK